jgi:hypothetical protein
MIGIRQRQTARPGSSGHSRDESRVPADDTASDAARSLPPRAHPAEVSGEPGGRGPRGSFTSTATTPSGATTTGFRSIFGDLRHLVGSWPTRSSSCSSAPHRPRVDPDSRRATASCVTNDQLVRVFVGDRTIRNARSARSSAVTPPRPEENKRPNDGSCVTPTIVSTPGATIVGRSPRASRLRAIATSRSRSFDRRVLA